MYLKKRRVIYFNQDEIYMQSFDPKERSNISLNNNIKTCLSLGGFQ